MICVLSSIRETIFTLFPLNFTPLLFLYLKVNIGQIHNMDVAAILLAPETLWEHKATVINLLNRMLERGSEELPGLEVSG